MWVRLAAYRPAVDPDGRSFQLFLEVYGTLPRASAPGGAGLDRVAILRARFPDDPAAAEVAAAAEVEIEIDCFRRFSHCHSYEFFVVQPLRDEAVRSGA